MSKYKKTRQEKIIADFNRQVYSLEKKNIFSLKNNYPTTIVYNDTASYSYVFRDVSKTLILTLILIGLQIILFFLLKKQVLLIPNLNY
ncbi:MAG: hypothetical protein HYW62_04635 [Candidatus Levybacteria bacterium]|nr:hypothetical protein [Candidatus Levybacteria bacterium]